MNKNSIESFKFYLRTAITVIMVLFNTKGISAQFVKEGSYSIMSVVPNSFFDSISAYIINTAFDKVYDFSDYDIKRNFKPADYFYEVIFFEVDKEHRKYIYPQYDSPVKIQFDNKSKYRVLIMAFKYLGDGNGYIFNINGLRFYSSRFIHNFFIKSIGSDSYKYFFNTGVGYTWAFNINYGEVSEAFAFLSTSENPSKVIDLINKRCITYEEFASIFERY